MKKILERKRITKEEVYEVLHYFLQPENEFSADYGAWYMQGGCYEMAVSLGTFIENHGGKVEYWSYGWSGEPDMHVAIVFDGQSFDATLGVDLGQVAGLADVYTHVPNVELEWTRTTKRYLEPLAKGYEFITEDFEYIYNKLFKE